MYVNIISQLFQEVYFAKRLMKKLSMGKYFILIDLRRHLFGFINLNVPETDAFFCMEMADVQNSMPQTFRYSNIVLRNGCSEEGAVKKERMIRANGYSGRRTAADMRRLEMEEPEPRLTPERAEEILRKVFHAAGIAPPDHCAEIIRRGREE